MKIKFEMFWCPDWFIKFRRAEWWDEYKPIMDQYRDNGDLAVWSDRAVEFYKSKGITAWHDETGLWLEIDLDEPEWTMRMLKYQGQA
jgi:hypothetical protein